MVLAKDNKILLLKTSHPCGRHLIYENKVN